MIGLFRRLIGKTEEMPISPDPFGREAAHPPAPPSAAAVKPPPPQAILRREEIIDARMRLAGYRYLVEASADHVPSAAEILSLCQEARIKPFAERRLIVLTLAAQDWLAADFGSLASPRLVVHFSPPREETLPTWLHAIESARTQGIGLAVSVESLVHLPETAKVDLVLIDYSAYSFLSFEQMLMRLSTQRPDAPLWVDRVPGWAERHYCHAHGAAYCSGPFATAPFDDEGETLNESRIVLIEMLNLVRQDADIAAIAAVAKRDPAVTLKLVALANSPVFGLERTITSLEQAILMVGRESLYRWLAIGLFRTGKGSPRDEMLLEIALTRGRLLELIGTRLGLAKHECDELFLVGLLSLIDSLLGQSITQIVERLRLPQAVRSVLLDSSGPWGRYLLLALAAERDRGDIVATLAEKIGLTLADLASALNEARAWAEGAIASDH
ncbi:MAG: HDOD domain-containing protein [Rhodocyclaceae bacterium]|nr:HDOD domain-containing protein [Rhodocyclaceae bacterium]